MRVWAKSQVGRRPWQGGFSQETYASGQREKERGIDRKRMGEAQIERATYTEA